MRSTRKGRPGKIALRGLLDLQLDFFVVRVVREVSEKPRENTLQRPQIAWTKNEVLGVDYKLLIKWESV